MNLVKWDPFRELESMQARLTQLFGDRTMPMPMPNGGMLADWAPAVDIQETDKEYVFKADLPEVKKEDVKVELQNGVLSVEGERKQEKEEKGKKFHKIERSYGHFVRRFELPIEVDAPKVFADFKDGVLNVHLPKTATAKPQAIDIKVA